MVDAGREAQRSEWGGTEACRRIADDLPAQVRLGDNVLLDRHQLVDERFGGVALVP